MSEFVTSFRGHKKQLNKNKLQKLEDALVKQMLTAADRADQA